MKKPGFFKKASNTLVFLIGALGFSDNLFHNAVSSYLFNKGYCSINPGNEKQIRKVTATIAVDEEFIQAYTSEKSALSNARLICSRAFMKIREEFSIDVSVEKACAYKSNNYFFDTLMLLEAQYKVGRKSSDILIIMTKQPLGTKVAGIAGILHDTMIVNYIPRLGLDETIIQHEFLHLFGSGHSEDETSIMFHSMRDNPRFDESTKKIVNYYKNKVFF